MKSLLSIVLPMAILGICLGEVFNESQDAVREIGARFAETEKLKSNVIKAILNEKGNINDNGEKELMNYLQGKTEDGKAQVEKDTNAVIKAAIVKARPIQAIQCIRNVTRFGEAQIENFKIKSEEKGKSIRRKKYEKIEFDEYAVTAIMSALEDLVSQAIEKITHSTGPIGNLKKEALNNCEAARLLLGEIEVNVHEPILNREYVKTRQDIDRAFRTMLTEISSDLEKCLEVKPKY